jgi:uridine kinase
MSNSKFNWLTISIAGPVASGKSSLLSMIENNLIKRDFLVKRDPKKEHELQVRFKANRAFSYLVDDNK